MVPCCRCLQARFLCSTSSKQQLTSLCVCVDAQQVYLSSSSRRHLRDNTQAAAQGVRMAHQLSYQHSGTIYCKCSRDKTLQHRDNSHAKPPPRSTPLYAPTLISQLAQIQIMVLSSLFYSIHCYYPRMPCGNALGGNCLCQCVCPVQALKALSQKRWFAATPSEEHLGQCGLRGCKNRAHSVS